MTAEFIKLKNKALESWQIKDFESLTSALAEIFFFLQNMKIIDKETIKIIVLVAEFLLDKVSLEIPNIIFGFLN